MKVTQKFWAVADNDGLSTKPAFTLRLLNWNPEGLHDYVLVRKEPYEIAIDLPDEFDFRLGMAGAIRGKIQNVQAEAQNEIMRLTEALNSILAIEA
jgi:hypothetical protein